MSDVLKQDKRTLKESETRQVTGGILDPYYSNNDNLTTSQTNSQETGAIQVEKHNIYEVFPTD